MFLEYGRRMGSKHPHISKKCKYFYYQNNKIRRFPNVTGITLNIKNNRIKFIPYTDNIIYIFISNNKIKDFSRCVENIKNEDFSFCSEKVKRKNKYLKELIDSDEKYIVDI